LPTIVAVPVSWQKGRTKRAATSAFLNMATATPRSLGELSGSERIAATFARWAGRRRKETSRIAWLARRASPSGATTRTSLPLNLATETYSLDNSRYLVSSFPRGNGSWYWNSAISFLLV
jgi:hypothetical protein